MAKAKSPLKLTRGTSKAEPKAKAVFPAQAEGETPTKSWTGTIKWELLNIPALMYTAARGESVSFNQLHGPKYKLDAEGNRVTDEKGNPVYETERRKLEDGKMGNVVVTCGCRLKQGKMTCTGCGVEVEKEDIIKGYAIDEKRGEYVHVSKEEIDAQKALSSDTIEILEFVPAEQVDPIFFESSYYLSPDSAAGKRDNFGLLREAMAHQGTIAVAKCCMRQRENLLFLMPYDEQGMIAHTAYMADEVRPMAFPSLPAVSKEYLAAAIQLMERMTHDFDPNQYRDDYRDNLLAMIQAKHKGETVQTITPRKPAAQVVSILDALKGSLAVVEGRKKKAAKAS